MLEGEMAEAPASGGASPGARVVGRTRPSSRSRTRFAAHARASATTTAHRQLPLPRPHGRRQDRAGAPSPSSSSTTGAMLRLDMSEFHMEKHRSPASSARRRGYVGYEEGGRLTGRFAAARTPSSSSTRVEKAPSGRLERAAPGPRRRPPHRRSGSHRRLQEHGDHPSSNIGSQHRRDREEELSRGGTRRSSFSVPSWTTCGKAFRPSSSTASTRSVVFNRLERKTCTDHRHPARPSPSSASRSQARSRRLTAAAKDVTPKAGWDPQYGADRSSARSRSLLEDALAKRVIAGEYPPGTQLVGPRAQTAS